MKKLLSWLFAAPDGIKVGWGLPFEVAGPPILIIGIVVLFIFSAIWVSKDALKRGKNPFLTLIFVTFLAWPFSLFWWFWLRPELTIEKEVGEP